LKSLRYKSKSTRTVISRVDTAREMIGDLQEGDHITGLTAGQFSMIDIIEHCVDQLGQSDVSVSTWTTGIYDVTRASSMMYDKKIKSIRFLLDSATFQKSPEYSGPLIEACGKESFRCLSVHAKVTIIDGEKACAVVRSSMNLNKNLRTEQFDVSVCKGIFDFYKTWFDMLWCSAGEGTDSALVINKIYDRYQESLSGKRKQKWKSSSDLVKKIRGTT
jgi:hypothetical protein